MITVHACFDPFLRAQSDFRYFHAAPGETIAAIVERSYPPDWFRLAGAAYVFNPQFPSAAWRIDNDKWHTVSPKDGMSVYLTVTIHGGGSGGKGKNTVAVIGMLAVLAGTAFIASGGLAGLFASGTMQFGLFTAGSTSALLASSAFGIAGTLALKALFPPPIRKPESQGMETPVAAGVSGNPLTINEMVPFVLGTMVVSPPYLARPYTTFENGDVYANAIVGLRGRHDISGLQINGTDATLFSGVTTETRNGLTTDSRITIAPYTVIEDRSIGQLSEFKLSRVSGSETQLLDQTTPSANYPIWHYATTDGLADEVWIRLLFPLGIYVGTSRAGVPIKIAMRKSGSSTWINLPEFHISDKAVAAKEIRLEIKLKWVSVTPNSLTNYDTDALVFAIYARPGSSGYNHDVHAYFEDGASGRYALNCDIEDFGATVYLQTSTFERGEYEFRFMRGYGYVYSNFNAANYTMSGVNCRFYDADETASPIVIQRKQEDMISTGVVETVSTFRVDYPILATELALIAVKAKGVQIESISATFSSYAAIWDGAAWAGTDTITSNPAAIYRSYLYDDVRIANPPHTAMVDDTNLALFYNESADKGYECNLLVSGDMTVKQVLQQIAATGHGVPRYGQEWGVVYEHDRTNDTVAQLFTPLTTQGLTVEKAFNDIPHALVASFVDDTNSFKQNDSLIVYAPGYNGDTATQFESISYPGITDPYLVRKRAELDLAQMVYRNQTYVFDAWIENLISTRGDLVHLSDDMLSSVYGYARVREVLTSGGNYTGLVLDATAPISASESDMFERADFFDPADFFNTSTATAVAIRKNTGTVIVKDISETADGETVTFSTAFADDGTIERDCIVAVGSRGHELRRVVLFDIERKDEYIATITALDEAPEIWAWKPYAGAVAHFDFTRQKYYWGGLNRTSADFATFTSPAYGAGATAGLVPTSSTNITLAFSALGIAAPFTVVAVCVPTSSPGGERWIVAIDNGSTLTDGYGITQQTNERHRVLVWNTSVAVVNISSTAASAANNVRHCIASVFETNNVLGSQDGAANGFVLDVSCTLPTISTIRFARRSAAGTEFVGALRHVLFFAGDMPQTSLDNLTRELMRL